MTWVNDSGSATCQLIALYSGNWLVHAIELTALLLCSMALLANLAFAWFLIRTPSFHAHLRAALGSFALATAAYFLSKIVQQMLNFSRFLANLGQEEGSCIEIGKPFRRTIGFPEKSTFEKEKGRKISPLPIAKNVEKSRFA